MGGKVINAHIAEGTRESTVVTITDIRTLLQGITSFMRLQICIHTKFANLASTEPIDDIVSVVCNSMYFT